MPTTSSPPPPPTIPAHTRAPVAAEPRTYSRPQWQRGQVVLCLLGDFRLISYGVTVALPGYAQRVPAPLAVPGGGPRWSVGGSLWPDSTPHTADGNLRSALWRINKVLPAVV